MILALQVALFLPSLYLVILTAAASVARWRRRVEGTPALGHLAFVVPAHDEEKDIACTIASIREASDDDCSIHVVADNCTDATAAAARAAGALVWERSNLERKSKGYALEWALPRVFAWGEERGNSVVFVAIVDADARLGGDSVMLARRAFGAGAQVLQSEYRLDMGATAGARVAALGFAAMNVVRGLGRLGLGTSDTLKGNGMWFTRGILESFPWRAYGLAEDFEYALSLIRAGIRIEFLRDAVVWGAPARTRDGLREQRVRWESGRLSLVLAELPVLLREFLRRPTLSLLDAIADLCTPPLAFLVTLQLLAGLLALSVGQCPWVALAALGGLAMHVLATVPLARLPLSMYGTLLAVPGYVLWKLLLMPLIWRRRKSRAWVRAARLLPFAGVALGGKVARASVDFPPEKAQWTKANEKIFCLGYGPWIDEDTAGRLKPTLVRWGGNTSTRFNPKLGNAWNAGHDWQFKNVQKGSSDLWWRWISGHRTAGRAVQFTVPVLGWVAKDGAGQGSTVFPGPERTSVRLTTEEWDGFYRRLKGELGQGERIYPLDNEPFLWHKTHADVVSAAISPQDFAARWLEVARAVRRVDPEARLTGPGLWGYGDLGNLKPFLQAVADKVDDNGKPFLDIVTTAIYPQAPRLQKDLADITGMTPVEETDESGKLRLATVANVDSPDYVDPSWIERPVRLIPRIREIMASVPMRSLPALAVSEYNWGAPGTVAGAAAQAWLLQKFLLLGLDHACSFTWPPPDSRAGVAFREYRQLLVPEKGKPAEIALGDNGTGSRLWFRDGKKTHLLMVVTSRGEAVPQGALSVQRLGPKGFEVVKGVKEGDLGSVWHLTFPLARRAR